jgi:mannitol/fructose-specific phosphotransferase system IIA component (Ntr-type)
MYKISDFVSLSQIENHLLVKDKDELFLKMVSLTCPGLDNLTLNKLKEEICEREKICSTGIGKGIAIPHCKTHLITGNKIGIAVLQNPIDYQSNDSKLVNLVFMVISNEDKLDMHLKLLSRIARFISHEEFDDKLKTFESNQEILFFIKEEEEKIINGAR